MTRKILCLCLAALLLVSLAGCGKQEPVVESVPETTAAPVVTEAPNVTEAPETTKAPEKSGCGSSAAFGGLVIVAILGTAIVFKKK